MIMSMTIVMIITRRRLRHDRGMMIMMTRMRRGGRSTVKRKVTELDRRDRGMNMMMMMRNW